MINVNWSELKTLIDAGTVSYRHIELSTKYIISAWDEDFKLQCLIYKNSDDATAYEATYKSVGENQVAYSKGIPVIADKGNQSFDTYITHDWTDNTSWSATNDSEWILEPSATTKMLIVVKSEVQFSHDVQLGSQTIPGEFYFDIWAYNPLVDLSIAIDPDDPTFVPGVSSGNPLRFLYKRSIFYSIRDVFNYGNSHFTMDKNVDGIISGVTTVQFNYDQNLELDGSQGMQLRFSLKDDNAMAGDFCTVSIVGREQDL